MQFRDLQTQYQTYKKDIDFAIQDVIATANFIGGKEVGELESQLAEYVGVKHCISCANGTEAMSLVMMAWGITKGDAVFVPDFTFFSTGEIVSFVGATPIFIDVDKDTFNMDPEKLEISIRKITADGKLIPKVIIPVDLFGLPANHHEIARIAKAYNLLILEDAAQGFGGSINGKRACSFGDAATTSFFPAKPLGCYGDGGAIFTNSDELTHLIKSLKVHGEGDNKYDNIRIGINSRLDTIQAAILKVKLKAFIRHELEDVNRVFGCYNEKLKKVVEVPVIPAGYISSFAQYTIKLKSNEQRESLRKCLEGNDIPCMIYYTKPMHKQRAFTDCAYNDIDNEVATALCQTVLSLPMHPYLKNEEIDKISDCIITFLFEGEINV